MNDIMSTNMSFPPHNRTNPTHITSTSNHAHRTNIELDKVRNLAGLDIVLGGIVHPDQGIGVADGPAIVSDDVGNALVADRHLANLEKLVGRLLRGDAVDRETTLDIVKETEVLARLLNGDDV